MEFSSELLQMDCKIFMFFEIRFQTFRKCLTNYVPIRISVVERVWHWFSWQNNIVFVQFKGRSSKVNEISRAKCLNRGKQQEFHRHMFDPQNS